MTIADGPGHRLGPGWVRGADGVLSRRAARVVLVAPDDRVLLIRGHDADLPERSWWFTVGGGIDDGESAHEAAVREVREETGIEIDVASLVGPVLRRSAVFDFVAEHCRQEEDLFLARLTAEQADASLSTSGWTDLELDVIDELRWFTVDELAAVEVEVFPATLVELLRPLLAEGWDGTTIVLREDGPTA